MSGQIIPLGELLTRTWDQYKQRALPVVAVILISTVIIGGLALIMVLSGMFGGAILTHFMDRMTGLFIIAGLVSLLFLVVLILAIWCQGAILAITVDEDIGIIEAFQKGWEYLWPLTWVITILSGVLTAGLAFGLLPAFLFLTWFSFAVFILFEEDRRGMQAMLASREYVRGYGWNIFVKLLFIWILSLLAGIIPFIGQILSILFTPFLMLYVLTMYRDLKSIRGVVDLDDRSDSAVFWWIVTAIGLLVPVAVLAWLLYMLFSGDQQLMPHDWQGGNGIAL